MEEEKKDNQQTISETEPNFNQTSHNKQNKFQLNLKKKSYQIKKPINDQHQIHKKQDRKQIFDPIQAHILLMRADIYINNRYPYLININTINENYVETKTKKNSSFFVIKSFSEEDVHKAIKYKVWSSTKNGNQILNLSFKKTVSNNGDVYFFFSCNGSGRFIGLARMVSALDEKNSFMYWTQDSKWSGLFDIEWIFIKDIPFKAFKSIEVLMKDGQVKPVTYSRDTQEIPYEDGVKMIEIFDKYNHSNTILEHFEYYDIRQENYEKTVQGESNLNSNI